MKIELLCKLRPSFCSGLQTKSFNLYLFCVLYLNFILGCVLYEISPYYVRVGFFRGLIEGTVTAKVLSLWKRREKKDRIGESQPIRERTLSVGNKIRPRQESIPWPSAYNAGISRFWIKDSQIGGDNTLNLKYLSAPILHGSLKCRGGELSIALSITRKKENMHYR
jgi:hypothetical protein